jgi:hypothetical protein
LGKSVCVEVDTPKGKATLEEVFVTELGYVMVRVYYKENKTWVNYRVGEIDSLIKSANIKVLSISTKKRTILKKEVHFKATKEENLDR